MPHTIIVSDLHADTWGDEAYGEGPRSKAKLQHWCDFLDWCEQKQVDELILNGDLMDAPPYEGNVSLGSSITRQAIEKLTAYASRRPVTYLYGNHDIGISGLRCAREAGLPALHNIALIYPDYVLKTGGSTVLLQHGHLYDPALWLYVRDLTVRTYIRSHFQAFQWVQQRRDPETGAQKAPPGVGSPAVVKVGPQVDNNIYKAMVAAEASSPPSKAEADRARKWMERLKNDLNRKVSKAVTHYFWREAARDILRDYAAAHQAEQKVVYCVMGHTHVPDRLELEIDGKPCKYFNSGTWTCSGAETEDRQHATYLDIDESGKLWAQDWIRDAYL